VVDDQLTGDQRVDARGISAERAQSVAHRRKVDDGRDAGEVLQQDAFGAKGDLPGLDRALGVAEAGDRFDVRGADLHPVFVAEEVLEEDLHGVGEPVRSGDGGEPEDLEPPVADVERGTGAEAVRVWHAAILPLLSDWCREHTICEPSVVHLSAPGLRRGVGPGLAAHHAKMGHAWCRRPAF